MFIRILWEHYFIMRIRNKLIKLLGGYTNKEYLRIERKYQALLDSKSDATTVKICNEYIYRTLCSLDQYARKELYGLLPDMWAKRMYNIIHNNMLRILIRYIHANSATFYYIDTTLNDKDEFKKIIQQEGINIPEEIE